MQPHEIEQIELELLLDAIHKRYGYDFKNYSKASFARRVKKFMGPAGFSSPSEIIPRLLFDKSVFDELVYNISVVCTEMFRDPWVYQKIREVVVPYLKTYPFFKVWVAGCASGEEAYSMAILLIEEGLYERCRIYATDMNTRALDTAKRGIFPIELMKKYTLNHQKAGGKKPFSNYYRSGYDSVILDNCLKKNIVFSSHNLVRDESFGEMQFILCRNVLIYFNQELQNRALKLFYESLGRGALLCLGTKETIAFSDYANRFRELAQKEKLYQKI